MDGRVLTNHNKLLWQYEGCIGLKTGYTEKAGGPWFPRPGGAG